MRQAFTIEGRFVGLNEFYRMDRWEQHEAKREHDGRVAAAAKAAGLRPFKGRVRYAVTWYEANRRRDLDNVAFGKKFIQDGLVKAGVLHNDTHHEIAGFEDSFAYDARNPRIVVEIWEVEE